MLGEFKKKIYYKDISRDPIFRVSNSAFSFLTRGLPLVLSFLGFGLLLWQVVIPLVVFETATEIATPVSDTVFGKTTGFSTFKFEELADIKGSPASQISQKSGVLGAVSAQYFYLSIPKLRINDAVVEINSETLSPDKYLGHYRGSSLPGDTGNTFIYGHSVLPMFYNPKNYKAIFSTLDTLKIGDEMMIKYKGTKLIYKVESMVVLDPDKVNPLAEVKPRYLNESTITLMTCVPPGTKLKRLLVSGVMVSD